jgi:hypothetical protein
MPAIFMLMHQNKWALVLLPAPTAPDFEGPLLQEQFSPVSGVRLAYSPKGQSTYQTAVGFRPTIVSTVKF